VRRHQHRIVMQAIMNVCIYCAGVNSLEWCKTGSMGLIDYRLQLKAAE